MSTLRKKSILKPLNFTPRPLVSSSAPLILFRQKKKFFFFDCSHTFFVHKFLQSLILPNPPLLETELLLISVFKSKRTYLAIWVNLKTKIPTYPPTYRFQKCIEDCNIALEIDPNFTKAWIRKGRSYQSLGNFTVSMSVYILW